jgi:hypothetical protein
VTKWQVGKTSSLQNNEFMILSIGVMNHLHNGNMMKHQVEKTEVDEMKLLRHETSS